MRRSSKISHQEKKEAVAKLYFRKTQHHSTFILPPSLLSDSLSSQITGRVTDTALHCWHYGKSYTSWVWVLPTGKTILSHICLGHAHSPGKLCRLLLCPSHSPCHSYPQKGGNHWAWCIESLPGSKDHIAYHRMWPPLWRLQPLQVPCILQTHTRKPNSRKFQKEGQIKIRLRFIILFIVGGLV